MTHHEKQVEQMPLYVPVKQRQRWGEEQHIPHTEWSDILFDLFFVAAAYNLGNVLREDPSSIGLFYVVALFLPLMTAWILNMIFRARYSYQDDIIHNLLDISILLVLGTAVKHIRPPYILGDTSNPDAYIYALAVTILSVLQMIRHLEVVAAFRWKAPHVFEEAYHACRRDLISGIPSLTLFIAATAYASYQYHNNDERRLAEIEQEELDHKPLWLLAAGALAHNVILGLAINLWVSKQDDFQKVTVPLHVTYCIHRWGEYTMVMLGETVLSLVIVDLERDYYPVFFAGVVAIILLQYLHFRSQPHEPDEHVMRRNKKAGYLFSILQQVYCIALVILGTCYKMFLYEFVYDDRRLAGESTALRFTSAERQDRIANLFSGSLATVFFCMDTMSMLHKGAWANWQRCSTAKQKAIAMSLVVFRVAIIGFFASLSQYKTDPRSLAYLSVAGIFLQLILRGLGEFIFKDDEEEENTAIERTLNLTVARLRDESESRRQVST